MLVLKGGDSVDVLSAGLPNITGSFVNGDSATNYTGAFYHGDIVSSDRFSTGGENDHTAKFDASRVSAIYGRSNTVQPPAVSLIPQIRY